MKEISMKSIGMKVTGENKKLMKQNNNPESTLEKSIWKSDSKPKSTLP